MKTLLISLGMTLALVAAGCGDDAAVGDANPATPSSFPGEVVTDPVDGDDCSQGGAFAEDTEFRQAVCRPFMAMVDVIGNGEIDPEWSARITSAILKYADDRAGALSELQAVLADIESAAD